MIRAMRILAIAVTLAGCGRFNFDPLGDGGFDTGDVADAYVQCTEPWSSPMDITVSTQRMFSGSVTADDLEMFLNDDGSLTANGIEMWVSTRPDKTQPFGLATLVMSPPNSVDSDADPSISDDGLEIYFYRISIGVYTSQRATRTSPWSTPVPVTIANFSGAPDLSSDRMSLYGEGGSGTIVVATRPALGMPFGAAVDVGPGVNSDGPNLLPTISYDELELYFTSTRAAGDKLWVSRRASKNDPWGPAVAVPNSPVGDDPDISADGRRLYNSTGSTIVQLRTRCGG